MAEADSKMVVSKNVKITKVINIFALFIKIYINLNFLKTNGF